MVASILFSLCLIALLVSASSSSAGATKPVVAATLAVANRQPAAAALPDPSAPISLAQPHTFYALFKALTDNPAQPYLAGPVAAIAWTNAQIWSDRFGFVVSGRQLRMILPDPSGLNGDQIVVSDLPALAGHLYEINATLTTSGSNQMSVTWTVVDLGIYPYGPEIHVTVAQGVIGGVAAIRALNPWYQEDIGNHDWGVLGAGLR
jgi:hypothetical protein